mmetsp:Transcript_61271/g.162164  ORF Transcript_61271/g.162164 Transcript_61271/m.162164 type:complete len:234 (+) Transcript_61271:1740-2441(+)
MSRINDSATVSSASLGHAVNQSMVQQLMSEGNLRSRVRKASPIGDMQSTTCRLLRQFIVKSRSKPLGVVSVQPISLALPARVSAICDFSSDGKRLGTSPALSRPLMSSRYDSSLICVSAKMKTVGLPIWPACRSTFLRSSNQSTREYDLDTSIWKTSISATCAASRVTDCRPEPPTPTSSALPRGMRISRWTRTRWPRQSSKSTRFIAALDSLYSSSAPLSRPERSAKVTMRS